jgi:hypothetical protein
MRIGEFDSTSGRKLILKKDDIFLFSRIRELENFHLLSLVDSHFELMRIREFDSTGGRKLVLKKDDIFLFSRIRELENFSLRSIGEFSFTLISR